MKASELIKSLQKSIDDKGDTEVIVWEDDICQYREINGVSLSRKHDNAIVLIA